MFRECKNLRGCRLGAVDGEIGKVHDFYFDDRHWTVRYLVADTGYWLPDRLVLISPHALGRVDDREKVLGVNLTRQQIEDSPSITADQPVSRQYEREFYKYYGWPVYWTGPALWGPGPHPLSYAPPVTEPTHVELEAAAEGGDPHLRSVKEVTGYGIQARDGEIGSVTDLILEEANWAIRYFVIDTGKWLPGKHVLIAPQWIESFSWDRSTVAVDLPRQSIKQAPEYNPDTPLTREYEVSLFKHYSREGYWA